MRHLFASIPILALAAIAGLAAACGESASSKSTVGSGSGGSGAGANDGTGGEIVITTATGGFAGEESNPCLGPNPPDNCQLVPSGPACGDGNLDAQPCCPPELAPCEDAPPSGAGCEEQCDDGNSLAGDGCNGGCRVEPNFICPVPGQPCEFNFVCGNGVIEPGEVCDDGNALGGDGCNETCELQDMRYDCITPGELCVLSVICGDGRVEQPGESCEDGNTVAGDGCDALCAVEPGWICRIPGQPCELAPRCGDGVQDPGEVCDDGNITGGDGCTADCLAIEAGYLCPTPGVPCDYIVECGDGVVFGNEQCDDANTDPADGCDACVIQQGYECPYPGAKCIPLCGDGFVLLNEACDDGNVAPGDGCSPTCEWEDGWACSGAAPNYSCHTTTCGDGIAEGNEPCDDGNGIVGDGCTPFCQIEPICSGGSCTSICGDGLLLTGIGEVCDDGNTVNGDGCSSTCTVEPGYECTQPPLGESLTLPLIVRDFDETHPDFNFGLTGCEAASTGMVDSQLDAEGKPVLIAPNGTSCATTTTAASFATWYRDTPGTNTTVVTSITLWNDGAGNYVNQWGPNGEQWATTNPEGITWCANADGSCADCTFEYEICYDPCTPWGEGNTDVCAVAPGGITYHDGNPVFFPIDGQGQSPQSEYGIALVPQPVYLGNWQEEPGGALHNFHFTSEVHFWFQYDPATSPTLDFTGDDDVWVFINNRLAVDLGGIHVPVNGSVNLATAAATLGLEAGTVYEIVVFQVEREKDGSSYRLTLSGFNTDPTDCGPICGDGVLSPGEQCDNGTNPGGYGECNPDCTRGEYCGDGIVNGPEQCDDGLNVSAYGTVAGGCAPGCVLPARCGDGNVDAAFGERCDDGIIDGSYGGCTPDCQPAGYCGDGIVHPEFGEQCDDGINDGSYNNCGVGCVLGPRCGDGVLEEAWGEECDDGNNLPGDNCSPNCRLEGICGDAIVDPATEACDDGVNDGTYGMCAPGCVLAPHCGDGVVNGPEECDDGANLGGYGSCAPGCVLGPRCGDGVLQPGWEECDDGNNVDGDRCSAACQDEVYVPE